MIKQALLVGLIFGLFGLSTLTDYGVNWDIINHLPRGQAYLRYFLTGKKDYSDLQVFFHDWGDGNQWYWQKPRSLFIDTNLPKNQVPSRSLYQIDSYTYNDYLERDGSGHPPLSDILSAAFNRILFGQLRLVNDIDSYRVYGICLAASLVALVYFWASKSYGKVAGLFASLSLAIYPLFWSESHFNTEKDIPETAFWSFFLYAVWKGVKERSFRWLLTSGIFFGLALGTKFNILFSVLIIIPWMIFLVVFKRLKFDHLFKVIISGCLAFVIGLGIFIGTWPYLWADPIARIQGVLSFYKGIGASGANAINIYPLQWIAYTTPLIIMFLFLIGFVVAIYRVIKNKDDFSFLIVLWLAVPILREVAPGASFYGGVRQIMEYIPAMAILAGFGAQAIYNKYHKKIVFILLLLSFVPITLKLISIHPNENVYFNPLIGGLSGAKKADLPYWGFSFGAPYRQGIKWINEHAEKDSALVYARELIPNIPRLWVRPDLQFHNANRSGPLKLGEYVIALTYRNTEKTSYFDRYLDRILIPVYEEKVDGVAILKVWKNDIEHTRPEYTSETSLSNFLFEVNARGLKYDLSKPYTLSRLDAKFIPLAACSDLKSAHVRISGDGQTWVRLPGEMPKEDWSVPKLGNQPSKDSLLVPFAADEARFIEINIDPVDACLKNVISSKIFVFEKPN